MSTTIAISTWCSTADKSAPVALLNDRLGEFHEAPIEGIAVEQNISGLLTTHFDADGRADVVAASANGPVQAWRNTTERTALREDEDHVRVVADQRVAMARGASGRSGPGRPDRSAGAAGASGKRGEIVLAGLGAERREAIRGASRCRLGAENPALSGLAAVDLVGDPLPDLF